MVFPFSSKIDTSLKQKRQRDCTVEMHKTLELGANNIDIHGLGGIKG